MNQIRYIANRIARKVKADEKEPVGNQNCLLCTLYMEANLKGIDILPRPVYLPRDIIFKHESVSIVNNSKKIPIVSKNYMMKKILEINKSRYYIHINWAKSQGGHEFLIANIDNSIYVIDAQVGLVTDIASSKYFDDINWSKSYMYRVDNKDINRKAIEYNDEKYILPWDENKDVKYLENLN